jgi:heavy metal efflux system protein
LQKTDSLFSEFLEKATLRFNEGETNILEKTTAENQQGQIRLQLNQLQRDMDLTQLQFQLLLNTAIVFIPDETDLMATGFKVDVISNPDTSFLKEHPAIQFYQQRKQIAAAATQAEKSKLLPDLILGYNIMSIRGTGANDKEYNSVPRFQSVQIGLGIPIFNSGQKAKISAAKTNEMVVASEYELNLQNFETAYKRALLQYQKNKEAVAYYEKTALKNAEIITASVNQKFVNGDINYLEWVMLVNQAISIQSDYIEAVKNLNESAVEINSFINQKNN